MNRENLCEATIQKGLTTRILKLIGKDGLSNVEFFIDFISNIIKDNFVDESINDDEMSKIVQVILEYFEKHYEIVLSKEEINIVFHQLVIKHCDFLKDIHHLNAIFRKHNK